MKKHALGDEYIKKFPKFKKWINECVCCHQKGYNPEIPDKITTEDGSYEVYYIKKYFNPLQVDEEGLCSQCKQMLNQKEKFTNNK